MHVCMFVQCLKDFTLHHPLPVVHSNRKLVPIFQERAQSCLKTRVFDFSVGATTFWG